MIKKMCYASAVFLLVLAVKVSSYDVNEPLERDEVINAINSMQTSWKAGRNFHPSTTKSYIKNLLGAAVPISTSKGLLSKDIQYLDIPSHFDAREKWSHCKSIHAVPDQGDCGSCWAVASAGSFSDRLCIATNGTFNEPLSAEELVSCCHYCGYGCNSGYALSTWRHFVTDGVVTGGSYGSNEGCQPYNIPPKGHPQVTAGNAPAPKCYNTCTNKSYKKHNFTEDHHKAKDAFQLENLSAVQKDMLTYGPLVTYLMTYEDFLSYKSGIYKHHKGNAIGWHIVRLVGWGETKDDKYWICVNSWNSTWGDQGTFKIKRGEDESGIEEHIIGGHV